MARHLLVHYFNIASGREQAYADYFANTLKSIPELAGAQRFTLASAQLGPTTTGIKQPFQGLGLYDLGREATSPAVLAKLADVIRTQPMVDGLLSDDRSHLFEMLRDHIPSPTPAFPDQPAHVVIVMANYVHTMRREWSEWYDSKHEPEILGVPGINAFGRGMLAEQQVAPPNAQPANGVVVHYDNTNDLAGLCAEFAARSRHTSPSGVKWSTDRSPAATRNRTTHAFTAVTPVLKG